MKKSASAVSIIGGADGPTSVFLCKRNSKLTLRQFSIDAEEVLYATTSQFR